jgi:hypothetical protein
LKTIEMLTVYVPCKYISSSSNSSLPPRRSGDDDEVEVVVDLLDAFFGALDTTGGASPILDGIAAGFVNRTGMDTCAADGRPSTSSVGALRPHVQERRHIKQANY